MFVLIQNDLEGHEKYIMSKSYNDLIDYINTFENVKKLNDYNFMSNQLFFMIKLGEVI